MNMRTIHRICLAFLMLEVIATTGFAQMNSVVLPHIIDGGGWKTIFTIYNPKSTSGTVTLSFTNEQGGPWLLPLYQSLATIFPDPRTSNIVLGSPGYAVQTWETSGIGAQTSEGWGLYSSTNAVFVSTIVRQIIPGQPQAEADASLASCGNSISVPFDYRNGFSTGVALVNNGGPATIVATVYNAGGIKLSDNLLDMGAKQHMAFSISDRFPVPAGQQGSVGFIRIGSMGAGDALCGLAFQFNPSGNFGTTHFAIVQ